ncbi:unnamed protein product [Paramecium sonneborni]|uniref:Uncharacterized protein n=1 Tax=Paramecium sonneborni TaxID=65129 RepID=A0A8S1MMI1_9CILI|nr:unnamed protein product [Paramecium sonneborni]
MSKQHDNLFQNNRSQRAVRTEQNNQFEIGYLQPTLKQVNSPHQSQSISPIRSQHDLSIDNKQGLNGYPNIKNADQQIEALIQEIEKQNTCIKQKTQQIQECQSKISQLDLHYGLKIEELETQHLYQISLTQNQLKEKQQENANLINEINQLKSQKNKYNLLAEQINAENYQLREQIRKNQILNSTQTGDLVDEQSSKQQKLEIIQIKQQIIKLNEIIKSLEEQNKYQEEEYNQIFKENQYLINIHNNLTQQLETSKKELLQLQEEKKEFQDKMTQIKEEFDISQDKNRQKNNNFRSNINKKFENYKIFPHNQNQIFKKLSRSLLSTINILGRLVYLNNKKKIYKIELSIKLLKSLNKEKLLVFLNKIYKTLRILKFNTSNYYKIIIVLKNNFNNIQHQSITFQISHQEFNKKLTVMLKNRLNEIELWKNKCYENNSQQQNRQLLDQLIQDNEILRQKCNILEINIKENSNPFQSQEINKLNLIIKQQQDKIIQQQLILENQKKQMSSPKNQKTFTTEINVKDFNQKNKHN